MNKPLINLIIACGQNGEIGLGGGLPWEGEYAEDREWYTSQTLDNIRVGTRGAIMNFTADRPSVLVSSSNEMPEHCLGVYNWHELTPDHILNDIKASFPQYSIYIVGGVECYQASAHVADRILLTRIAKDFDHDRKVDLDLILANRKLESSKVASTHGEVTFETWV